MREGTASPIRREDYAAPAFWIRKVELTFDLDPAKTMVINRMQIERNAGVAPGPLKLHGEELVLTRCLANGESVSFRHDDGLLVIDNLPEGSFTLEIRNTCAPQKNTQLSGLYTSGGGFFTQCEAEGFRRITFFLDRPDVMAEYTVLMRADKAAYPVLLSNGNLVEQGDLDNGRHFAKWHDPFPKPSYLFALVAAKLVAREQHVRSRAGKDHLLQVWVRRGDLDKTEQAMNSLVASLVWDEARFGLALDLERFMIVAVGDFNMGAMENKGLNIFNTRYVLANPATATDEDFAAIESVVGHEYFHNWTGNRVTCRDWFQLSLKEGLTVFRDQEFSMDMLPSASARAVKRIEDVRALRQLQFPEDAGPMAHPVRPDSYVEIDNFYTPTVYEKGAEVVRMMQTLVGRDGFARGMTLYFERHDGQAVTCDDFAQAMADANPGSDLAPRLAQFKRWYAQAGTPRLTARGRYDAPSRTYTLGLEQSPSP
ncbi:MAG: aminopeptidase N, partial [Caldimonas sp.]